MTGDTRVEDGKARIEAIIERVIRPMLVVDGGDVQVRECTEHEVVLRLLGSCSGCAGRPYTTARMIEPALRQALGASITITFE